MTNHKELTTEERAKCFALYLGYPVGSEIEAIHPYGETPDEKVRGYLTGIHGEYGVEFQIIEEGGHSAEEPAYQDYDKCQLILLSLEDISDEDIIAIGKMGGMDESEMDNITPETKKAFAQADMNDMPYPVADFLRSRSYALPWVGQSLFDLGIAERKQR